MKANVISFVVVYCTLFVCTGMTRIRDGFRTLEVYNVGVGGGAHMPTMIDSL